MQLIFAPVFHILAIVVVVLMSLKGIHIIGQRIVRTRAFRKSIENNLEREKRISTLVSLFNTGLRVGLYSVGGLMILKEMGFDITPILTGAGIAGVAVGFGAQSLVKDVISGFFLLLEDQIRVGDVVTINGSITGKVERVELRITALRGPDGSLNVISNGEIKLVSNQTYDFSRAVVSAPVAYSADVKRVQEEFMRIADELEADPQWKGCLRDKPKFKGITSFTPAFMQVEISVKTDPQKRWDVERELRTRVKLALDKLK